MVDARAAKLALELCGPSDLRDRQTVNTLGFYVHRFELIDTTIQSVMFQVEHEKTEKRRAALREELRDLRAPTKRAELIYELGGKTVRRRELELSEMLRDRTVGVYERFREMILSVRRYLDDHCMRLEPFQLELLRGTVLGIAWKQLRDDLYKHKHELLAMLGLSTPEMMSFDPQTPNPDTARKINEVFNYYAKPYTLGMAPRQCGKTTIMSLVLAACINFLDITVMVIAQNKNMSETIHTAMMEVMASFETARWFNPIWRVQVVRGSLDTRVFTFDPRFKGDSKITFLSSSPKVRATA